MPEPTPKPAAAPTNTRQWSVRSLDLPAAEAIAKLRADETIPSEARAYLIALVERSGFAGVSVDAHEHALAGATILHASVSKLY